MKFWNFGEIRQKVERDLDLEGETFITATEMLGYANEAIDEVERQILTLCEDYFLTRTTITLVPGEEEYAIPTDIYALKIRKMVYRNNNQVWAVDRVRDWNKFLSYELDKTNLSATQHYKYFIVNQAAGAPKLLLTPTPTEAGSFLQVWYLRNANEMVDDTSVCDIPEAVNYVMAYIRMKCMAKEMHPNLSTAIAEVEAQKSDTLKTLAEMVPDNENNIEADTRLYDEMN